MKVNFIAYGTHSWEFSILRPSIVVLWHISFKLKIEERRVEQNTKDVSEPRSIPDKSG